MRTRAGCYELPFTGYRFGCVYCFHTYLLPTDACRSHAHTHHVCLLRDYARCTHLPVCGLPHLVLVRSTPTHAFYAGLRFGCSTPPLHTRFTAALPHAPGSRLLPRFRFAAFNTCGCYTTALRARYTACRHTLVRFGYHTFVFAFATHICSTHHVTHCSLAHCTRTAPGFGCRLLRSHFAFAV